MSTVIFFKNVPHIVRYGVINPEEGMSSMHFYRNGIHIDICVYENDVKDTPFFSKWKPIVEEHIEDGQKRPKNFVDRWNRLCTCIIGQSLTLLEALAPEGHQWRTLSDHFHTLTYKLKMSQSVDSLDAVPIIVNGPITEPSFEHLPIPFNDLDFDVPDILPRISATNLLLFSDDKDYRQPPYKVQYIGEGHDTNDVFFFKPAERSWTAVETGKTTNISLERIEAHLRLHQLHQALDEKDLRIPKVIGVVTDTITKDIGDNGTANEVKFAGLLLTYLSHAMCLAHLSGLRKPPHESLQYTPLPGTGPRAISIKPPTELQINKWASELRRTLEILHKNDLVAGSVWEGSVFIPCTKQDDGTVFAEQDAEAWLVDVIVEERQISDDRVTKDEETEAKALEHAKQKDVESLETMLKKVREKLNYA